MCHSVHLCKSVVCDVHLCRLHAPVSFQTNKCPCFQHTECCQADGQWQAYTFNQSYFCQWLTTSLNGGAVSVASRALVRQVRPCRPNHGNIGTVRAVVVSTLTCSKRRTSFSESWGGWSTIQPDQHR